MFRLSIGLILGIMLGLSAPRGEQVSAVVTDIAGDIAWLELGDGVFDFDLSTIQCVDGPCQVGSVVILWRGN